jgi:hypothetical protein
MGWLLGYWGLTPKRVRQEVVDLRRAVARLQDALATEVLLSPGDPEENAARAARLVNSGWEGQQ